MGLEWHLEGHRQARRLVPGATGWMEQPTLQGGFECRGIFELDTVQVRACRGEVEDGRAGVQRGGYGRVKHRTNLDGSRIEAYRSIYGNNGSRLGTRPFSKSPATSSRFFSRIPSNTARIQDFKIGSRFPRPVQDLKLPEAAGLGTRRAGKPPLRIAFLLS